MNHKMKNKSLGFWVSHILVVAWMILIFCFSMQQGEDSGNLSGGITHMLVTFVNQLFGFAWSDAQVLSIVEWLGYPIRKLAHMTEFGILAVLIFSALKYYVQIPTTKKRYLFAWLGAVCYAATDEFHQIFVPDRSGNLFDICVDALGAAMALTLLYLLRSIYGRIR